MNKFRFFLSALICMLSLNSAWAEETYTDCYDIIWRFNIYNTDEAYIVGVDNYNGYPENIEVPEIVSDGSMDYTVISVGHPTDTGTNAYAAFEYRTNITGIILPPSLTTIGYRAFHGCTSLSYIEIPNSVTTIKNMAFAGCSGLESVDIPGSVTCIEDWAFSDCTSLTSVAIPDQVESIGEYAFYKDSKLSSIEIPNSVESIGYKAFYGCSKLARLSIGSSVTSIGKGAFGGCNILSTVYNYATTPQVITDDTFSKYGTLYVDANSVDDYSNSDVWQNFTIKRMVYVIASGYCGNNLQWTLDEEGVITIYGSGTMPNYSDFSRSPWNNYKELISKVVIQEGVTSIGDRVFYGCSGLTSVEIPNSVTSIGSSAFEECSGLTSVVIPNSVTSIGRRAFIGCM